MTSKRLATSRTAATTRHAAGVALAIGLLGGCAAYTAKPLTPPPAVLAAPDAAALSIDAAKIDRPFLTPQPIDLGKPLTPEALAVIAVIESPDLKAERARVGVAEAQAFAARLLPDPTLTLGFDKLLSGPDSFDAFAGQFGLDLNQLRLARVTREASGASQRQVRLDLAWAEWQAAGQARLQGVRILALEAQLGLARQNAALSARFFAATLRAATRGDIGGADVDARRQSSLDGDDKVRTIERDLGSARAELNRQLGLPPRTELRLAPTPLSTVPIAADALVAQAIEQRLDLQALRAGYASSEAALHRAVLEQFPALSLTVAGGRDTSDNYTAGPQIGFTLPVWNRNRGGIAVASATRAQLHAEYEARIFQARSEIAAAASGIQTLRGQRVRLVAAMPQFQRFADASARAAARGDLAAATAAAAAQALNDRKLTLLIIDQQAAEQMIALELLTGSLRQGWTR